MQVRGLIAGHRKLGLYTSIVAQWKGDSASKDSQEAHQNQHM
jgi:hypothetical protein